MATYLGFLRAINLGPTRKFPRTDIVAATEGAGFAGVATHINTGNVRFETAMRSRARIERTLETAYAADRGFAVPTIVFAPAELRRIVVDAERFGGEASHEVVRHYVSLLKDEPAPELIELMEAQSTADEVCRVSGRAVHLLVGSDYRDASLTNATVERRLGVATNRNLTVIRAIVAKWC